MVTQLRSAVDELGTHFPSYGKKSLVGALDARGRIPKDARRESAGRILIEHPFGGRVTVIGATSEYSIKFAALEKSACVGLADGYVGSTGAREGLVELRLNDVKQSLPLGIGAVAAGCNDKGGANSIEFIFR